MPVNRGALCAHGPTVRALRRAHRQSLAEVAARAALSVGYLSRIENSRHTASEAATSKLAAALDVPPETLTGQRPILGRIREVYGIGHETLAADLAIPTQHLAAIETGADFPTRPLAEAIARRLGVPTDALFPTLDTAAAAS